MKTHFLRVGLQIVAVTILFAACGALSSIPELSTFPNRFDPIFPIPFALLCALLWMRSIIGAFAFSLMIVVWLTSSSAAFFVGMSSHSFLHPGVVGGLPGSLGLVLCAAICYPSLFSLRHFAIGALVGSLAGLAFEPWSKAYMSAVGSSAPRGDPPWAAFALWETAVGTYLYAICARRMRRPHDGDPHEEPQQVDGTQTLFSASKGDSSSS